MTAVPGLEFLPLFFRFLTSRDISLLIFQVLWDLISPAKEQKSALISSSLATIAYCTQLMLNFQGPQRRTTFDRMFAVSYSSMAQRTKFTVNLQEDLFLVFFRFNDHVLQPQKWSCGKRFRMYAAFFDNKRKIEMCE